MSQTRDCDSDHRANRPKRYQPLNSERFGLTVHWADGGEPTAAEATLIDISAGGFTLSLDSQLKLQQAVSLTIEVPESKLHLTVPAEICWLRSTAPERWTAGCAFLPELPSNTLEDLFASGILERRALAREPMRLAARAEWELDPGRFEVELQDASEGGICLRSPRPGKLGTQLMVYVPVAEGQEVQIPARSQWQAATGADFLVGCAFMNVKGWSALQECLATTHPAPEPTVRRSHWWSKWLGDRFRSVARS